MSPRNSIFAGIACIVVGLPPLAIGTGLLSAAPGKPHAPLWVVTLAGSCFVVLGVSFLVPSARARTRGFLVGATVTMMAIIFDWIAFGPGERHFSATISFGGIAGGSGSGETSGRILFGICAIALDGLATWGWYRWLKGPAQDVQ
jgi:hypothetical protein